MKRFTVTVGAFPVTAIEGVQFADGRAAMRVKSGLTWDAPYVGRVSDLTAAYGGFPDYVFTWLD